MCNGIGRKCSGENTFFHDKLKLKLDTFVHRVYAVSRRFPKEEIFGVTSQIRRAALSVVLNYIEGYARRRGTKCKVCSNFLDIAYGSLKEGKYLIYFCYKEKYLDKSSYDELAKIADELGAMLWSLMNKK